MDGFNQSTQLERSMGKFTDRHISRSALSSIPTECQISRSLINVPLLRFESIAIFFDFTIITIVITIEIYHRCLFNLPIPIEYMRFLIIVEFYNLMN